MMQQEESMEGATPRQTWAIFCMTHRDHRALKLSKGKASEIIGKLMNGETVLDCPCGGIHTVKPRLTEERVKIMIAEAREAGRKAGLEQLAKLQAEGDKWKVKDESGREVGKMLDLCGGAWLVIDAKQAFYRIAKELSKDNRLRFSCDRNYSGGGHLSIYDMSNRQEASVNKACYEAAKEVLEKQGVKVLYVHTFID